MEAGSQNRVPIHQPAPSALKRGHIEGFGKLGDKLLDIHAGLPSVQAVEQHATLERRERISLQDIFLNKSVVHLRFRETSSRIGVQFPSSLATRNWIPITRDIILRMARYLKWV